MVALSFFLERRKTICLWILVNIVQQGGDCYAALRVFPQGLKKRREIVETKVVYGDAVHVAGAKFTNDREAELLECDARIWKGVWKANDRHIDRKHALKKVQRFNHLLPERCDGLFAQINLKSETYFVAFRTSKCYDFLQITQVLLTSYLLPIEDYCAFGTMGGENINEFSKLATCLIIWRRCGDDKRAAGV